MKPASSLYALILLLVLAWGCSDNQYCENFDLPTAQTCEGNNDCSAINCNQVCEDSFSDSRGGAFCEDPVCQCPCRVCVGYD